MDLDQLTTALAQHDPDPQTVLAALNDKRHRYARNRWLVAASGGVAAAAIVVVVTSLGAPSPHSVVPGERDSPPPAVANGCAVIPLSQTLAMARQSGASVIVATGTLTGKTADRQLYHEMTLQSVQTITGPPIASGSSGWINGQQGPAGPVPGTDAGALWAPDGRLFAIAWPETATGTTIGPVLRIAPVVGDKVVFSTAGCWDTTGLPTQPYHGTLAEIPGSNSYARAATSGFHALALTTVEQLLTG
ncbi:MAG TPA: hypothetical protein VF054_12565 [Micromonosporaceae bacterium]